MLAAMMWLTAGCQTAEPPVDLTPSRITRPPVVDGWASPEDGWERGVDVEYSSDNHASVMWSDEGVYIFVRNQGLPGEGTMQIAVGGDTGFCRFSLVPTPNPKTGFTALELMYLKPATRPASAPSGQPLRLDRVKFASRSWASKLGFPWTAEMFIPWEAAGHASIPQRPAVYVTVSQISEQRGATLTIRPEGIARPAPPAAP